VRFTRDRPPRLPTWAIDFAGELLLPTDLPTRRMPDLDLGLPTASSGAPASVALDLRTKTLILRGISFDRVVSTMQLPPHATDVMDERAVEALVEWLQSTMARGSSTTQRRDLSALNATGLHHLALPRVGSQRGKGPVPASVLLDALFRCWSDHIVSPGAMRNGDNDYLGNMWQYPVTASGGTRLSLSSVGYLVFGPQTVEVGDEIVLVRGWQFPLLLRRAGDGWEGLGGTGAKGGESGAGGGSGRRGTSYWFRGLVYVGGIMHGELRERWIGAGRQGVEREFFVQ
jgi:hypothetical protein